jgi:hypothetical protein
MPHDMNGVELKVGDRVNVEMIVYNIYPDAEMCNVVLARTKEQGYPETEQQISLSCQAKQTLKVE